MEGWHEAWKSTTKSDELETENDDPETNEARIRLKVARAIQNPEQRTAALRFMAFAVDTANEDRSDAWVLRELTDGLELIVGRLVACRIRKSGIRVSVVGPVSEDDRAALDNSAATDEPWAAIAGGLYIKVAAQRALALDLLKDAHAMFIDAAIARVRRGVDLGDHCADALTFLSREVGRELPQPEVGGVESSEDELSAEDAQASRAPKIRGRAPIFEHGQRAIASLMEAVDPAAGGTIALPDLQRPFVWEDTKVRDLLDSLFIGFPVGTLVLWHTEARDARAVGDANQNFKATTLVIDGQQRLTSLFAVMRGAMVAEKDDTRRAITIAFRPRDGRFEVADAAIRKDPEFIPNITELWNGQRTKLQMRKDLTRALADAGRSIDEQYLEAVEINLERAHAIQDYRFPTVEIRKTASAGEVLEEDVADIFVRINNQGTRLGQADFVLTLLSVFHGALRDRIEASAREMSRDAIVAIDTQQVLRMACAVGFGRARMSAVYRYLRGVDPLTGDAKPEARVARLATLDQATNDCLEMTRWRDYMLRVMHAGFVSPGLVSSTNAVTNAYAFYILGRRRGVAKQPLEEGISRWLFATLLTARYSTSSEATYEEDLSRVREVEGGGENRAFLGILDEVLDGLLTDDYWTTTVPSSLVTQRSRAPAALAFRAAQIVLGCRGLFSDQLLQNLLAPPGHGGRSASEMHHIFPKAWLKKNKIVDQKRINQVANLADVGWHENSVVGSEGPSRYVPRIREMLKIDDDKWGRMCAEHALPLGWESMDYAEFLEGRRPRMAEIIRTAFRKLGGESQASQLPPPWFLPGAEMVWKRVAEAEFDLLVDFQSS
jgi:hypothetical protein